MCVRRKGMEWNGESDGRKWGGKQGECRRQGRTCWAWRDFSALARSSAISSGPLASFTTARFWMPVARDPKRSVESVSLAFHGLGLARGGGGGGRTEVRGGGWR